jgi:glycosyltransferase involved in cell wall biosynthesis
MLRFRVVYKATMVGLDDASCARDVRGAAFLEVVDRWACIAEPLAAAACDAGVREERILRVPNGIDFALFRPAGRRKAERRRALGLPETGSIWATTGAIVPRKGHDLLIEAWHELSEPRPLLLIIGPLRTPTDRDAGYVRAVTTRIEEFALSEVVKLIGERSDVPDLLAACDGFVFASRHEGLPNAVLEALAVGLPVVTTTFESVEDVRTLAPDRVIVVDSSAQAIADAVGRSPVPVADMPKSLGALSFELVADRYAVAYGELLAESGIKSHAVGVRA